MLPASRQSIVGDPWAWPYGQHSPERGPPFGSESAPKLELDTSAAQSTVWASEIVRPVTLLNSGGLPDGTQTVAKTVRRRVKRAYTPFMHQWKAETAILSEGILAFLDHNSGRVRLAVDVAMIQTISVPKAEVSGRVRLLGKHSTTAGEVRVAYFCNANGTLQEVLFQSSAADNWREVLLQSMNAENDTGAQRAFIPAESLDAWCYDLIAADRISTMLQEGRMKAFFLRRQAMLIAKGQANQGRSALLRPYDTTRFARAAAAYHLLYRLYWMQLHHASRQWREVAKTSRWRGHDLTKGTQQVMRAMQTMECRLAWARWLAYPTAPQQKMQVNVQGLQEQEEVDSGLGAQGSLTRHWAARCMLLTRSLQPLVVAATAEACRTWFEACAEAKPHILEQGESVEEQRLWQANALNLAVCLRRLVRRRLGAKFRILADATLPLESNVSMDLLDERLRSQSSMYTSTYSPVARHHGAKRLWSILNRLVIVRLTGVWPRIASRTSQLRLPAIRK